MPWNGRTHFCLDGRLFLGPTFGLGLSFTILGGVLTGWYSMYLYTDVLLDMGFSIYFIVGVHSIFAYATYCDVMAHIVDPGVLLTN